MKSHCNKKCKKCKKCKKIYDVIIVGAGTAGSIAAKRISDNTELSVLVLDAGSNQNQNPLSLNPFEFNPDYNTINLFTAAVHPLTADVLINQSFAGVPPNPGQKSSYDQTFYPFHSGRGWGGQSNHNYLLAIRPSPEFANVCSSFAGSHANKWGPERWNQVFQELEKYNGPVNPNRGTDGRWGIAQVGPTIPVTNTILEGLKTASPEDNTVPIDLDYNTNINRIFAQNGQQFLKVDPVIGERSHAGNSFLGPDVVDQTSGKGVGKRKLKIKSNAFVNKICFCKNKKVKSVKVSINGKSKTYYSRHKIIICAGAFRTPGILERSGIGNFTKLQAAGVKYLVHDNHFVGENFHTHVGPSAAFTVSPEVYPGQGNPAAQFQALIKIQPGMTPNEIATGKVQSRRVQILVNSGLGIPGTGAGQNNAILDSDDVKIPLDGSGTYLAFGWNLQPTSRGSVHIADSNPETNPIIISNWNTTEEDKDINLSYYKLMKDTETTLQASHPEIDFQLKYPPQKAYDSDDLLQQYAASWLVVTDHASGTAAMGKVVDGRLNVIGVEGLKIADTSIFNIIPDANTALSAAFVGWQVADFVLEELA